MEGLESARHLNFKHVLNEADGTFAFFRDETVVNRVEVVLKAPSRIL